MNVEKTFSMPEDNVEIDWFYSVPLFWHRTVAISFYCLVEDLDVYHYLLWRMFTKINASLYLSIWGMEVYSLLPTFQVGKTKF